MALQKRLTDNVIYTTFHFTFAIDWMSVPQNLCVEISSSMSRCLEVGHLRDDWVMRADGIHALMKETPRAPSSLRCVRTRGEDGCLCTRKQPLTRHVICWCPDLPVPATRAVRDTFLCMGHPIYGIL